MADENYTDLPDGVFINREWDSQIQYSGTETAMLAAEWIRAEWLEGLSTNTRNIVLAPDSGFSILREGKGRCITNAHRDAGAITIKRLKGGELRVSKYRTRAEKKAWEDARNAKYKEKQEQEIWKLAKLARERDYLAEWKTNVIWNVGDIEKLAKGTRVFTGFPEIKFSAYSMEKIQKAIEQLTIVIEQATPHATDVEVKKNNVIGIRGEAYRHFHQS